MIFTCSCKFNFVFHSVEEAKKKWQNLKEKFARLLRKIPTTNENKYVVNPQFVTNKWPYYHTMMFMGKFSLKKIHDTHLHCWGG